MLGHYDCLNFEFSDISHFFWDSIFTLSSLLLLVPLLSNILCLSAYLRELFLCHILTIFFFFFSQGCVISNSICLDLHEQKWGLLRVSFFVDLHPLYIVCLVFHSKGMCFCCERTIWNQSAKNRRFTAFYCSTPATGTTGSGSYRPFS